MTGFFNHKAPALTVVMVSQSVDRTRNSGWFVSEDALKHVDISKVPEGKKREDGAKGEG